MFFRPGALGDVLAVRGAIRLAKTIFSDAEICILAPGERGELFRRARWADRVYDSERAVFSWLFSDGEASPSPALSAIFAGCDLFVSFAMDHALEHRVAELCPAAATIYCPSRPPEHHRQPIGEWLADAVLSFCRTFNCLEPDACCELGAYAQARLSFPKNEYQERYIVMHPGSGSARKNWPLDHFIALGEKIRGYAGHDAYIVVTSGEADGDIGFVLSDALSARHLHQPPLSVLAETLANASVYIGNDSGVSHLASAVEREDDGKSPVSAVFFGSSDSLVWGPPGAHILHAGNTMRAMSVESSWKVIRTLLESVL